MKKLKTFVDEYYVIKKAMRAINGKPLTKSQTNTIFLNHLRVSLGLKMMPETFPKMLGKYSGNRYYSKENER